MDRMVFINFPVRDLQRSTDFYEKLGFTKNEEFSNTEASAMMWNDTIWFMLLRHDFYRVFLKEKEIADTQKTNAAIISLSMDSTEAVKKFAEIAKTNGGDYYFFDMGIPKEKMYALEITDPDGNMIESVWMAD